MAEEMEISTVPASRPRVLVIEDETLIAIFVEQLLGDLGCDMVGPLVDIPSAVHAAETSAIDAAILNLVIGNVHAYAVAEILAVRGIPFAFASGVPRVSLAEGWRDRPFLAKPYLADDLRRLLTQLLPQWRGAVDSPADPSKPDAAIASAIQGDPMPVRTPAAPE